MTRWTRRLAPLILALTLTVGVAPAPTFAQDDAASGDASGEGEKSEGRPLDGYLATAVLVGLALFVVGKSARR